MTRLVSVALLTDTLDPQHGLENGLRGPEFLRTVPGTAPRSSTAIALEKRLLDNTFQRRICDPSCVAAGSLLQARFIGGERLQ